MVRENPYQPVARPTRIVRDDREIAEFMQLVHGGSQLAQMGLQVAEGEVNKATFKQETLARLDQAARELGQRKGMVKAQNSAQASRGEAELLRIRRQNIERNIGQLEQYENEGEEALVNNASKEQLVRLIDRIPALARPETAFRFSDRAGRRLAALDWPHLEERIANDRSKSGSEHLSEMWAEREFDNDLARQGYMDALSKAAVNFETRAISRHLEEQQAKDIETLTWEWQSGLASALIDGSFGAEWWKENGEQFKQDFFSLNPDATREDAMSLMLGSVQGLVDGDRPVVSASEALGPMQEVFGKEPLARGTIRHLERIAQSEADAQRQSLVRAVKDRAATVPDVEEGAALKENVQQMVDDGRMTVTEGREVFAEIDKALDKFSKEQDVALFLQGDPSVALDSSHHEAIDTLAGKEDDPIGWTLSSFGFLTDNQLADLRNDALAADLPSLPPEQRRARLVEAAATFAHIMELSPNYARSLVGRQRTAEGEIKENSKVPFKLYAMAAKAVYGREDITLLADSMVDVDEFAMQQAKADMLKGELRGKEDDLSLYGVSAKVRSGLFGHSKIDVPNVALERLYEAEFATVYARTLAVRGDADKASLVEVADRAALDFLRNATDTIKVNGVTHAYLHRDVPINQTQKELLRDFVRQATRKLAQDGIIESRGDAIPDFGNTRMENNHLVVPLVMPNGTAVEARFPQQITKQKELRKFLDLGAGWNFRHVPEGLTDIWPGRPVQATGPLPDTGGLGSVQLGGFAQ